MGLVGQMVRQQPDEDDTETATCNVGQPSDSCETVARYDHEMVTRRPSDGQDTAARWSSDDRDTTK